MKKIEVLNLIKEEMENGKSLTYCCKKYKKSVTRTAHDLKNILNFVSPLKNNKKHNYDESFFEKIDTEEKAYWLGFLYADGSVQKKEVVGSSENAKRKMSYKVEFQLAEIDKEHLEKFCKTIGAKTTRKENKIDEKTFVSYRTSISSKKIVEDLIRLGCVPKKSLILKFPTEEQVPEKFIWDFLRGYFDGDGCFCGAFILLGTEEFLEGVLKLFEKNIEGYKRTKMSYAGKARTFRKTGPEFVDFIKNKFYQEKTIFLERKKHKMEEYCLAKSKMSIDVAVNSAGAPKASPTAKPTKAPMARLRFWVMDGIKTPLVVYVL